MEAEERTVACRTWRHRCFSPKASHLPCGRTALLALWDWGDPAQFCPHLLSGWGVRGLGGRRDSGSPARATPQVGRACAALGSSARVWEGAPWKSRPLSGLLRFSPQTFPSVCPRDTGLVPNGCFTLFVSARQCAVCILITQEHSRSQSSELASPRSTRPSVRLAPLSIRAWVTRRQVRALAGEPGRSPRQPSGAACRLPGPLHPISPRTRK